jgi:enolase-phosphatase E1
LTIRLADRGIRVVLLDIEGTTTPIAFVHDVLFPFARAHLAAFLRAHAGDGEMAEVRRLLAREYADDLARAEAVPDGAFDSIDTIAPYVTWLMDRDRKSPGLKLLQGQIWEAGYRAGELRGQVYPDVPPAIRRWHAAGLGVAIYSSGSELAQRRLFESTEHGDLTPLLSGFFDTGVGAKVASESYGRIAAALDAPPPAILFVSDVRRELTAAREAGVQVVLSLRPGNSAQPGSEAFERVESFEELK